MIYLKHPMEVQSRRRFFLMLPVFAAPMLALAFICMGGGGAQKVQSTGPKTGGFNTKLPDAHFKKSKEKNKLGIYEEVGKDSAKLNEEIKVDPYYRYFEHMKDQNAGDQSFSIPGVRPMDRREIPAGSKLNRSTGKTAADSNADKIMQKLALLNASLKKNSLASSVPPEISATSSASKNQDINRLEEMMEGVRNSRNGDPDLDKLNSMLEKIMSIQHPDRIRDSGMRHGEDNRPGTLLVQAGSHIPSVSDIGLPDSAGFEIDNAFYGLDESNDTLNVADGDIEAVVDETQTLVSGEIIKLRLLQDIQIGHYRIYRNSYVYGNCSLNNERLNISIHSVRFRNHLFPVSLNVYDQDGLEGIFVPGSLPREAAKQSADQAMGGFGLASLDPSIGAQAASASIQAAKILLSKKIKLVRITIKAGYQVLLKDTHTHIPDNFNP